MYFKICQTYFKISQTYFRRPPNPHENRGFADRQTQTPLLASPTQHLGMQRTPRPCAAPHMRLTTYMEI